MSERLAQRRGRISDRKVIEIVRLAIRQTPHVEIAERVGVHRNTVRRVLERTRGTLAVNHDTEQERAEAVALYREVQRAGWEGIERGRSPAMLLAEIIRAQARIDTLLGLEPSDPEDSAFELARFKAVVVATIQQEAPQLAATLAQRLLSAASEDASPVTAPTPSYRRIL